jgi:hypothetical protein
MEQNYLERNNLGKIAQNVVYAGGFCNPASSIEHQVSSIRHPHFTKTPVPYIMSAPPM